MEPGIGAILFFALSTGILHALDADHVMAVTAIASKRLGMKAILRLCLKWSLGHGITLLVAGAVILALGLSIPESLALYAERFVAVMLIFIGCWILYDLHRSRAHFHFHNHDGLQHHAHWHVHQTEIDNNSLTHQYAVKHQHGHSAVLIGVVHGIAGLAPLLAFIPIANKPLWIGVSYLLIFCVGVLISMIIFGGLLGKGLALVQRFGNKTINIMRGGVAMTSIGLGVAWF